MWGQAHLSLYTFSPIASPSANQWNQIKSLTQWGKPCWTNRLKSLVRTTHRSLHCSWPGPCGCRCRPQGTAFLTGFLVPSFFSLKIPFFSKSKCECGTRPFLQEEVQAETWWLSICPSPAPLHTHMPPTLRWPRPQGQLSMALQVLPFTASLHILARPFFYFSAWQTLMIFQNCSQFTFTTTMEEIFSDLSRCAFNPSLNSPMLSHQAAVGPIYFTSTRLWSLASRTPIYPTTCNFSFHLFI